MAIIRKKRSIPAEAAVEAVSADQRELDLSASENVTKEDLQPVGVRLEADDLSVAVEDQAEEAQIEETEERDHAIGQPLPVYRQA
jgi:hypothetical protein